MTVLYDVDFRTLPSQTIGAAGAYTVAGATWWAKGQLTDGSTTIISNIVNGSGWHFDVISGSGTTTLSDTGSMLWRHLFMPLSQFTDWTSSRAYMVRARVVRAFSNSAFFLGVINSTSDSVGASQRSSEILVGQPSGPTDLVRYKVATGSPANATGRTGNIANNETVLGVHHFTPRFALVGSEHLVNGMPSSPDSWLAVQSVAPADYNGLRSNPGVVFTIANGGSGNDFYLQELRIETIGDTFDATPPTIENVTPAPGGGLSKSQAITFDLLGMPFALREFWVGFGSDPRNYDLVHNGTQFLHDYAVYSTAQSVADGYSFSIRRGAGWPAGKKVRLRALVVDGGGNTVVVDA